jgi:hypothetical protein
MNNYPKVANSMTTLIGLSFKYYLPILRIIFPLILLMVLVKDLYLYLGGLPTNHWLRMIIIFIILLLQVYLSSSALLSTNGFLAGTPLRLSVACRTIYNRIATIYLGFFALILIFCAIFFIGHLLSGLVVYVSANKTMAYNFAIVLLLGLPLTICLVLFFFIMPLLALGTNNMAAAFRESIALVNYRNWLKTFILYAICVLFLLIISPGTLHGQWLIRHHLNFVFDIIVFSLVLPLIFNFILFLLNDLRIRQKN